MLAQVLNPLTAAALFFPFIFFSLFYTRSVFSFLRPPPPFSFLFFFSFSAVEDFFLALPTKENLNFFPLNLFFFFIIDSRYFHISRLILFSLLSFLFGSLPIV